MTWIRRRYRRVTDSSLNAGFARGANRAKNGTERGDVLNNCLPMKKLFLPLAVLSLPASLSAQLVINELLADPPNDLAGDANGDGGRDSSEDEFIELINTSGASIDIGGWSITDGFGERHVFVSPTIVADGQAVVIFGGGTPVGSFGGAIVTVASSGQLGMNNGGDTMTLFNSDFAIVDTLTYGSEGGENESLTRDPDLTGVFVGQGSLGDGSLLFTPGTRNTGAPFSGDSISITVDPISFSEGAGANAATGTVTRSGDTSAEITVALTSEDETEVIVPASVIIPAGSDSATFIVSAVDDADQDEAQIISISASADELFSGSFQITVEDDEDPIPTIFLAVDPDSISENGGTATFTLEISTASDGPVVFDLLSDDTSELTVPANVTIAADQTSVTFEGTAVDDSVIDGTQVVSVTVSDPSALILSANTSISVTDDENFAVPDVVINEVRIDDPGVDDDEYIELYSPTAGDVSLARLFLVVIGDSSGGSGVVERVISLSGQNLSGGYFLVGSETMSLATPDLTRPTNFLENGDNISILLVSDFTAAEGDDLDFEDDGVLESKPWGTLLSGVSLVEEPNADDGAGGFIKPNGTEWDYSTDLGIDSVGPDGIFVPGHVFRSPDGPGEWQIGPFESSAGDPDAEPPVPAVDVLDSPGMENGTVVPPVGAELKVIDFSIDQESGSADLIVTGLGTKIWIVQVSGDLGSTDTWETLPGGFAEIDNADGSTTFRFFDTFSLNVKRFYRLIEQP